MRSRNVNAGIFKNETLADYSDPGFIFKLFVGLWCLADRNGRLEFRLRRIKAELFGFEPDLKDERLETAISYLKSNNFLEVYEVEDRQYLEVINFKKYQRPHPRESIVCPAKGLAKVRPAVPKVLQEVWDLGSGILDLGSTKATSQTLGSAEPEKGSALSDPAMDEFERVDKVSTEFYGKLLKKLNKEYFGWKKGETEQGTRRAVVDMIDAYGETLTLDAMAFAYQPGDVTIAQLVPRASKWLATNAASAKQTPTVAVPLSFWVKRDQRRREAALDRMITYFTPVKNQKLWFRGTMAGGLVEFETAAGKRLSYKPEQIKEWERDEFFTEERADNAVHPE